MRALITGAGGFVGGYLFSHLSQCGDHVVATDRAVRSVVFEQYSYTIEPLDVLSEESCFGVLESFRPDVIYHLAGITFVPEAERDFVSALKVNVAGTDNLLRACKKTGLGTKVVLISSGDVYGRVAGQELPIREDTPVRPANNYSLSKAMSELVAGRYQQYEGLDMVCMRPFNHIGPGQSERFVVASFAGQLRRIATGEAEAVIRVGNLKARRDFSDVRDIVCGYRLAAQKGQGIFNLCSGEAVSIERILEMLIEISGVKVKIEQDPARMRASDTPLSYGSAERAESELGWRRDYQLRASLEDIYRGVREGG